MQVQCFGLGMVKLDIRQESTRHSDVLDTITQYLGLGSYKYALLSIGASFLLCTACKAALYLARLKTMCYSTHAFVITYWLDRVVSDKTALMVSS